MRSFYDLLLEAKAGDEHAIQEMYMPLIVKNSIVDGVFDEDLYEELLIVLLQSIKIKKINFLITFDT